MYYRLNVLPLTLPPLRERREDIPVLMEHFLERFFRRRGEDAPAISPAVTQAFMRYDWPGNVRELENACERIAQTCTCGTVRIGCVAASILFGGRRPAPEAVVPVPATPSAQPPSHLARRPPPGGRGEPDYGGRLKASNGNKSKAAELLQVKRSTLGDRIKHCGLGLDHPASEVKARRQRLEQRPSCPERHPGLQPASVEAGSVLGDDLPPSIPFR